MVCYDIGQLPVNEVVKYLQLSHVSYDCYLYKNHIDFRIRLSNRRVARLLEHYRNDRLFLLVKLITPR